MTAKIRQQGQDRKERASRKGQPEKDIQKRTARKGQPEQTDRS
jgi:hypothetical protein